ncbi:hypothetical protein NCS56_01208800 [Fusarium sp. Ph1]|nr:hypothetical protein NCS56_01208800 [Fusarium sp. Ph1]
MFPRGGHGRGGQYFGPTYDPYGRGGRRDGGWGRGRQERRRGGHGAGWQGGRGGFPAAQSGQNHGQGYGQEDYEDGNRRNSGALARSEVSDLREQPRNEAFQSKVEELESVKRELESAIQAKLDLRSQACESVSRLRSKLTVAEEVERELRAELLAVKEAASEKGARIEALLKVLKELGDEIRQ